MGADWLHTHICYVSNTNLWLFEKYLPGFVASKALFSIIPKGTCAKMVLIILEDKLFHSA